ncbi:MAG: PAS domain-containing protein [Deltaproteobacteria bacterium]|nr:PAS domain-containing protein [Deltaproteobacteria bacterium]
MDQSNTKKMALLESILDHMKIAVTCVDKDGVILYANATAKNRPSKTPRDVGLNIGKCHKDKSNEKIAAIFRDFKNGRSEPHHYVATAGSKKELITMIPMFERGEFSGCVSHIYPLKFQGPERSF